MKKLKNGLLAIALLTGTVFMFNANESRGQAIPMPEPLGDWECCQSSSIGCLGINGQWFDKDYPYFGGPTCP